MERIGFPNIKPYVEIPREGSGLYYDSLYGYIPLPITIRKAMDLPTMQRLRGLRQLSTAHLIFPGAIHTRFEHSVGVFHLATRAFEYLFNKLADNNWKGCPPLRPTHKLALQLAALFHDVGHGPWGHAFDIFCESNPIYREYKHEIITERLIREGIGPYTDIPEYLDKLHKRLGDSILSPDCVASIAVGKVPHQNESHLFLSQIVSSEYDVDRMDYLRRDAFHTGIGLEVDIGELLFAFIIDPLRYVRLFSISINPEIENYLNQLKISDILEHLSSELKNNKIQLSPDEAIVSVEGKNDRWKIADKGKLYIIKKEEDKLNFYQATIYGTKISATAAPALESFLVARDLAYRRIYYHKTHRSATAMIIAGLQDISKTISRDDRDKLALLTDEELLNAFEGSGTEFTKDIACRIRFRKIYEPLPFEVDRIEHLDNSAKEKLVDLIRPKTIEEYTGYLSKLDKISADLGLGIDGKVIIDARPIPISGENEYNRKYLYDEITGDSKSMLEVLPHLKPLMDCRQEYINYISKILINLPFDFIHSLIYGKKQQILQDNANQLKFLGDKFNDIVQDIVQSKIMVLGLGLLDFLSIEDEEARNKFLRDFEETIKKYLIRLLDKI